MSKEAINAQKAKSRLWYKYKKCKTEFNYEKYKNVLNKCTAACSTAIPKQPKMLRLTAKCFMHTQA